MTSGSGSPGAGGDTGGSRRGASSGAGSPAGGFDGAGSSMGGFDGSSTGGGAGSSGEGGGGRLVMAVDGATPVPAVSMVFATVQSLRRSCARMTRRFVTRALWRRNPNTTAVAETHG